MNVLKSRVWPRFDSYTAWIEWGSLVHSGKMCTSFPAVIASAQAGDANSRDGGMNNSAHIVSDEAGRDIESHFLFMQID